MGDWDTLIAAYDASGNLDTAFGSTGYVVSGEPGTDNGNALVVQSDGKPVVAAQYVTSQTPVTTSAYALFRFNTNGTRDTSFGTNGLSQLADGTVPAGVFAIGLDPWGDIFAAGTAGNFQFRIAKWFQ